MCTQTLTHKHTQTHMYDARVCVYISSIGRKTYTRAYTCVCVCVYICYNIPDSKVWASSRSRETMALRWCLSAFSLKGRNSGKVRAIVYFLCKVTRESTFEVECLFVVLLQHSQLVLNLHVSRNTRRKTAVMYKCTVLIKAEDRY